MADTNAANVIDGEPEPSYEDLLAGIEERRTRWDALVAQAGDRVNEPGVAGDWTLRDVVAHVNAYLRFHVANLGGQARPFGEMPADIGFDMEKRNQWMHQEDLAVPWEQVLLESHELQDELMAQVRARAPEDLQKQLTDWHHWPTWRWLCDARNHYDEHIPPLEGWLRSRPA